MTTSKETDWQNHPVIRRLVQEAQALTLTERMTLLKGIAPAIARELTDEDYETFMSELRLKGERFNEARSHPGEGRATRSTLGERELEKR